MNIDIDPIHADLRTAIHIKKALDNIHRLQKLGYCPTKVQKFRKYFNLDVRDRLADEEDDEEDDEEGSGNITEESSGSSLGADGIPKKGFNSRDLVNQVNIERTILWSGPHCFIR